MATKINYEDVKKILMNTSIVKRTAMNYRDSVMEKIDRLAENEPKPPYHFIFAFEDKNDMEEFIKKNKKWFTPWSETSINEYRDNITKEKIKHMRAGFYYDEERCPNECYSYIHDYSINKMFINDKVIGIDIHLLHVFMSSTYINNLSMKNGSFKKVKAYEINRKTNKKESAGWWYKAIRIYNKEA
jgi:hypothetical protein